MFGGFRVFLGVMVLLSGLAKFAYMVGHFDFPTVIGPPWIEEKLAPHGLALVGRLLAYSQVIAGALLLSRFATIGAIIAFPIFLSITTVTVSQHWGIAPINKIFLLMDALVLAGDWHRLKFLIMDDVPHLASIPFKRISWKQDIFSLFGIGCILLGVVLTEYGVLIFSACIGLGILLFLTSLLFRNK
jgi:uncharacterized membrane protein YphA (DoxX/SURF4 family)